MTNLETVFEATIDSYNIGGERKHVPHIRIKEAIAKRFTKNWRGLVHSDLLEMFPPLMNKLAEVGVNSKGRELYDKGLFGGKYTTNYDEALAAVELYNETLKIK
jgi:hypothetical protein